MSEDTKMLMTRVQTERDELNETVEIIVQQLLGTAKEYIDADGYEPPPTVVAVIDNQIELYLPEWENDYEKIKVMEGLNRELESKDVDATVSFFPVTWVDKDVDEVDAIREDEDARQAVMIAVRTRYKKQLQVHPFTRSLTEVIWEEPVITNDFDIRLVRVPETN